MFKKLSLAAALCASASFASWDYFPVQEAKKGEIATGAQYNYLLGDHHILTPYLGSRYTVAPKLELGMVVPYFVMLSDNNDNGLLNPIFMARYQFLPMVNVFFDAQVPSTNSYSNNTAWVFDFGFQYSQKFSAVNFGSEIGLTVATRGDDKISPPLLLNFGGEFDFELGTVTPLVGAKASMELGKYTYEGDNFGEGHTGHMMVQPFAGAQFNVTQDFKIRATASTWFGKEELVGDEQSLFVDLKLTYAL